jgi:hypothetical protein
MTDNCIKKVHKMEEENEEFGDLSVEQLLYSAIKGSDFDDVKYVLEHTDWELMISKGKAIT